jgi:hypothetical protein
MVGGKCKYRETRASKRAHTLCWLSVRASLSIKLK